MKLGNQKVEQITSDGLIVSDYDQSLSREEIGVVFSHFFDNVKVERSEYGVTRHGKKFALLIKNITHLGMPWPGFKKRIQVPGLWNNFVQIECAFLVGLYMKYDGTLIGMNILEINKFNI